MSRLPPRAGTCLDSRSMWLVYTRDESDEISSLVELGDLDEFGIYSLFAALRKRDCLLNYRHRHP